MRVAGARVGAVCSYIHLKLLGRFLLYYVVDQNLLQRWEPVQQFLDARKDNCCVLTDVAFLELTQNEQWERTLRNSLGHLARTPERVFAAYSVNEALSRELRSLQSDSPQSVERHMLWKAATSHVREVLAWVRTGHESATILRMLASPTHADKLLVDDYFDHANNKETVTGHFDLVWGQLSPDFQQSLRKPTTTDEDRLDAVHQLAKSVAYGVLFERGVNRNRARVFLRKRPMMYRWFILKTWNALNWHYVGGLDGFAERRATNELLDHHYTLTASFFDGVLSSDGKVNRAYAALMELLQREVSYLPPASSATSKNADVEQAGRDDAGEA